jgi:TRAP-type mannitol/chloroaromatic compound transport system permease large subunit
MMRCNWILAYLILIEELLTSVIEFETASVMGTLITIMVCKLTAGAAAFAVIYQYYNSNPLLQRFCFVQLSFNNLNFIIMKTYRMPEEKPKPPKPPVGGGGGQVPPKLK